MHSPLRILALLVLALLATSAVAWKPINQKDTGICADKNQDAAQAIAAFCQRFPMKVPSRDAKIGRYSKNQKIVVRIQGPHCKPAESVSQAWCFKQFYNMCRNGLPNGTAYAKYGGGGCQQWTIFKKEWNRAN